jgi:polyamine oxidase
LKHDHSTLITPLLPQANLGTLDSLNVGLYTKIFMQLEEKFWEDTEFILTATEERGVSAAWQNLDTKTQLPGSRIIFQTVTDELAERAELSNDKMIKQEQLGYLRVAYGDAVTEPIDFHIARFLLDPLFLAGWGDWGLETPPDVADQLRSPLVNSKDHRNLYISGEATCRRYYGYTHGAFYAGKRDALQVLAQLGVDVEQETACENQEAPDAGPPYGNGVRGGGNK